MAARSAQQHPVVLLDEYQDTNFAQRVLLQLIYPEGSVITAVGDDMQSIYAFRGAHLVNVLRFGDTFPPADELPLPENRRFGQPRLARQSHPGPGRRRPDQGADGPATTSPTPVIECFLAADDAEEAATIAEDIMAPGRHGATTPSSAASAG